MGVFETLLVGFIWYQVIAHVGISAGLHRYFAHRAFKAGSVYETIVLTLATFAGARSPIGWIAAHRMHHAHSDTEDDPHSPSFRGFWTVMLSMWHIPHIPARFSKDLFNNPRVKFFHHHWAKIWIGGAVFFLLLGIEFFIAFVIMPAVLALIGFGCVNAICHLSGESKNHPWANILTAGEGYHAEHHDGKVLRFHKYDFTGAVLEFLWYKGIITEQRGGKWA